MPNEQSEPPQAVPFSFDAAKFDKLVDGFMGSFRVYREDSTVALGKMTDMNRDIASLAEKMMLLSLGTIGLSVSALISFVSKFPLSGRHKWAVVLLASVAWLMLLSSVALFRSIIADCMMANRKLLYQWISTGWDHHGTAIAFHGQRLGWAFTGTLSSEGKPFDPREAFATLSTATREVFESEEAQRFKKLAEALQTDPDSTKMASRTATLMLQVALLLLASTAIILFSGI